jgi:alpha-1,6-mannosyltransferase
MKATGLASPATDEPDWVRSSGVLLATLGAALATQTALALAFGSAPTAARNSWSVALVLCLFLSLPGAGVLLAMWRARGSPADWRVTLAVALTGFLMRVPYFGTGPMMEDDHFRYLLDGAMVAHGLSPYAHAPEALLRGVDGVPAELVEAGRGVISSINFPDLRSIYPGAAQALFALAHLLAPWSVDGLRLVILGAEALTAALIWQTLVLSGRQPLLVALYWCNPLMAFSLTGQAHIDAAIAPALIVALLAARRCAGASAGVCLGIAAGVKLWPILLAPLIVRALWPERRAAATFAAALGATTLALCGPLLWASLHANAGLTAYAGGWSVNNAPYAWASYVFLHLIGPGSGESFLRALVVLTAACASLAIAAQRPEGLDDMIGRAAILAAAVFYLSPAQFPWYAAWFLPMAAAAGNWVLAAAAVGLPIYYLFFPLAAVGLRDVHGYGLAFLHLAPVILAVLLLRRQTASRESS